MDKGQLGSFRGTYLQFTKSEIRPSGLAWLVPTSGIEGLEESTGHDPRLCLASSETRISRKRKFPPRSGLHFSVGENQLKYHQD